MITTLVLLEKHTMPTAVAQEGSSKMQIMMVSVMPMMFVQISMTIL